MCVSVCPCFRLFVYLTTTLRPNMNAMNRFPLMVRALINKDRQRDRQSRLGCKANIKFHLTTLNVIQEINLPCAVVLGRKNIQKESWKSIHRLKMSYRAGIVKRLLNASNKVSVSEAKRGIENRGDINGSQVRGKSDSLQEIWWKKYQEGKERPNKPGQTHLTQQGKVKNPIYDFLVSKNRSAKSLPYQQRVANGHRQMPLISIHTTVHGNILLLH